MLLWGFILALCCFAADRLTSTLIVSLCVLIGISILFVGCFKGARSILDFIYGIRSRILRFLMFSGLFLYIGWQFFVYVVWEYPMGVYDVMLSTVFATVTYGKGS